MVRFLRWALLTVVLVLVGASVVLVVLRSQNDTRADLRAVALMTAQSLEDRFFRQQAQELAWLSLQPEVRDFLEYGRAEVGTILHYSAGILDHDMVFLFDRRGVITASTREETVGASIDFRPYVQRALGGEVSFYVAKGVATLARGIYVAMPVFSHGQIQGGVAFRISGRQLDTDLGSRGHTLLVTAEGIVFSSSQPEEILRSLHPLPPTVQESLRASRQFPDVVVEPLGWEWQETTRIVKDDTEYLVEQVPLTSLASAQVLVLIPAIFPWPPILMTLSGWLLGLGGYLLISRQIRLVRERQQVEHERLQGAQLLEATLEGMALIDGQGTLVWTNPEFMRILGATEGKPLPQLAQLWDPSTPPGVATVLQGDATRSTGESVVRGLQGAWIPVAFGFSRFGADYLLGVLDLSEHVRSEALIHRSQRLSALGQLAGGVAHDLNNILGVLIGMTEILKESVSSDDDARESLELMSVTLGRATSLAEKLLDFARQSPLERKPVDLGALVRELQFLADLTLPPTIEAHFEVPPMRLQVQGDVGLLQSALLNLVVNAADAMENGGRLDVTVGPGGAGQVLIVVADQGVGMPPEVLKRIYEPFFTTKGPRQGTGLGLSLVRRTVVEHRGSIEVASTVGKGTTVQIRLPLIADPIPE